MFHGPKRASTRHSNTSYYRVHYQEKSHEMSCTAHPNDRSPNEWSVRGKASVCMSGIFCITGTDNVELPITGQRSFAMPYDSSPWINMCPTSFFIVYAHVGCRERRETSSPFHDLAANEKVSLRHYRARWRLLLACRHTRLRSLRDEPYFAHRKI